MQRRNPGTVRVSTENSKATVILSRCTIFRPATAEFRIIRNTSALCQNHPKTPAPTGRYLQRAILESPTNFAGVRAAGQSLALQVADLAAYRGATPGAPFWNRL